MIKKSVTLLLFTLFAACPNAQAMKHISKLFGKPQSYRGLRAEFIETKKINASKLTDAANLLSKEEANTSLVLQAKAAEEYSKAIQLMKSQPEQEKIKSIIQDDKERCRKFRREFIKDEPILIYSLPTMLGALGITEYLTSGFPATAMLYTAVTIPYLGIGAGFLKLNDLSQRRKKVANYKKEWVQEKIKSIEQGTSSQEKTTEKHS